MMLVLQKQCLDEVRRSSEQLNPTAGRTVVRLEGWGTRSRNLELPDVRVAGFHDLDLDERAMCRLAPESSRAEGVGLND